MMTRKDYVETARILADSREAIISLGVEGEDIFANLVADFAEMFENDNERFQGERFDNACWEESEND
jgi:DNA-binding MarR family transcriptional regulator